MTVVAAASTSVTTPQAQEVLWALHGAGHKLRLLTEEPAVLHLPATRLSMAPRDQWPLMTKAGLFIGPEVDVALGFVALGRRAVLVGEGAPANMHLAVVPGWDTVLWAVDWFKSLDKGPKVQIEDGPPGSVPWTEADWVRYERKFQ